MFTKLLKLLGYIIIPITTIIIIGTFNLYINNITSILTLLPIQLFAIIVLSYFTYRLNSLSIRRKYLIHFIIASLLVIIFPYNLDKPISSLLHILCAYIAFFYFNYVLWPCLNYKELNIYFIILGICFSIALYNGSITGLCEAIYICGLSILLTFQK